MWGYWDLNPGPRVSLVLGTSTSGARNDSRYTIPPVGVGLNTKLIIKFSSGIIPELPHKMTSKNLLTFLKRP